MTARPHSFRIPDETWDLLRARALTGNITSTDVLLRALNVFLSDDWLDGAVVAEAPAPVRDDGLSAEEREFARDQFSEGKGCMHCGGLHLRACPRVRRVSWRNKEDLAEVEYWPADRWPRDDIIWPEDVYEGDG